MSLTCRHAGCETLSFDAGALSQHLYNYHTDVIFSLRVKGTTNFDSESGESETKTWTITRQDDNMLECPIEACARKYSTRCSFQKHFKSTKFHPTLHFEANPSKRSGDPGISAGEHSHKRRRAGGPNSMPVQSGGTGSTPVQSGGPNGTPVQSGGSDTSQGSRSSGSTACKHVQSMLLHQPLTS